MTKPLPSPELLRKFLRADFNAGKLYWRERTPDMFEDGMYAAARRCKAWNSKFAGKEDFTSTNGRGYRRGSVFGRRYLTHRVIWLMYTGAWPVEHLDHINGDPLDNRIENLREATSAENQWNQGVRKTNRSGFKGVHWHKDRRKWAAKIRKDGKTKHLGLFTCPKEAHAAYCKAAKEMHGEYSNGG